MIQEAGRLLFGRDYHRQLAEALGVARRVVQRWEDGRDPVPPGVWDDLRRLLREREEACYKLCMQIASGQGACLTLLRMQIDAGDDV